MNKQVGRWNEKFVTGLWQTGTVVFAVMVGVSFMMERNWESLVQGLMVLAMSVLLQRMVCNWVFKKR